MNGHVKLRELLFHTICDLKKLGETAFISACVSGHTKVVKFMVNSSKEFGIDIDARKVNGETSFMKACYYGHTEIVKFIANTSKEFDIDLKCP